jgi:hypothetical protein
MNFPDANIPLVRKTVKEMREWMTKNNELKEQNIVLYNIEAEKQFKQFSDDYPSLFRLVLENKDLSILNQMMDTIEKINTNKMDKLDGEKLIGERLADEYLYPVVNKKKIKMIFNIYEI